MCYKMQQKCFLVVSLLSRPQLGGAPLGTAFKSCSAAACAGGDSYTTHMSHVCCLCIPQPTINQAPVHIFFVLWVLAVSVTCKCMYVMLSKIGEETRETFKSIFLGDGSCCFSHLLGMSINSPPLPLSFI